MKEIQLTKGRIAIVDDDMYEILSKNKWSMGTYYAYRKEKIDGKIKNVFMQHKVVGFAPKGFVVDHINRNKLDNRKENLRFATASQNKQNSKVRKDCVSGHKGITFVKDDRYNKKWKVVIKNMQKNKVELVGYYMDLNDAINAYKKRNLELNGCYSPYYTI